MNDLQPVAFACIAAIVAICVLRWHTDPLRAIPRVGGSSLPGLSYIAALRNMYDVRPNNLLQFLPAGESVYVTTQRLLTLNFAAIHVSSMTITQLLYHLAEDTELVQMLQEEIQTATSSDDWTSAALGKMWKLDSVLREMLCYNGVALSGTWRKAMKDVTLQDGTRIPRGTLVGVNAHAMHHDEAVLENADKFDPFRYERMQHTEARA